jgi:DNA polymerase III delta subunit
MLEDYINDFVDAVIAHDVKTMHRIEKDLRSLGMDRATLITLAREEYQSRKKEELKHDEV